MTMSHDDIVASLNAQKDRLIEMQQQFIAHQQQQILKDNRITDELKAIRDLVSQAKGGWKVAMVFGSISTVVVVTGDVDNTDNTAIYNYLAAKYLP